LGKEEFEFVKSQIVTSRTGEDMAAKNGKMESAPIVVK
jgi:hypothetical protein